ncbi:1-phosphofructokinase family hexose kinase [Rubrobacter indicoceani]|uniref:1-phosphofructokinase family hexose kinase n=1 Tax=Rubrobacter indicoceani TaxID=2051957 RepID=UPI000E5BFFF1|nr:1-phosphofructokinase family hexose kinase [Rubrobacter indicoceani]
MTIVTLTPNPSLDLTYRVEDLAVGAVQRAENVTVEAGGKGVNVTRNLMRNGVSSRAVFPVGLADGERFTALLSEYDIVRVPIREGVRMNLSIVEPGGVVTKINAPGPHLSRAEVELLIEETERVVQKTGWLALCGSVPPGFAPGTYARIVRLAKRAGCLVAVDTSGAPFAEALKAGPDVVKPNHEELAELVGRTLTTFGDVLEAAEEVRELGAAKVLVSLGPDGAILAEKSGAYHAETPPFTPRSTVGAGDSLLSGFLAGGGAGEKGVAWGVAWGAAAAKIPGTGGPTPEDLRLDEVTVSESVDAGRVLRDEAVVMKT